MKYLKKFELKDVDDLAMYNIPDEQLQMEEPGIPRRNPTDDYMDEYMITRPAIRHFISRIRDPKEFTPDELKTFTDEILNIEDFEVSTALLSYLNKQHKAKINYSKIWDDVIKRWHEDKYKLVDPDTHKSVIKVTDRIHGTNYADKEY